MQILNLEQGTKEWHDARMMKVTGTKLKAVMGTAEARRGLIAELIAEEATEQTKAFVTTHEMERGHAEEEFAVREFEKKTGKKVSRIGMGVSQKPGFEWLALSPDGLIETEDGVYGEAIEVKSPDSKKAILYRIENMIPFAETGLLTAKGEPTSQAPFLGIPSEYKWQAVQYFLVNPALKKLHFAIYDARIISDDEKLYIVELDAANEILQEAIAQAWVQLERFRKDWLAWKEIVLPTAF